LTFDGVHGVIFQKAVLFITTIVGTSNPTSFLLVSIPLLSSANHGFISDTLRKERAV
jgi:hypothetical protein